MPAISDAPPLVPDLPPARVTVKITLIHGDYSNKDVYSRLDAPVILSGGYEGLSFFGFARVFDGLLDSWLTRAVEMGMIGLELGQLFPVDLQRLRERGLVKARCLLLVGMGEPSRFAVDDLQFAMSNVTVAVKHMGYDRVVTVLPGTRRNELPVGEAVQGFIRGIQDGYNQFSAIVDVARQERQRLQQAASAPLHVMLVESDRTRLTEIEKARQVLRDQEVVPKVDLIWSPGETVDIGPPPDDGVRAVEPEVPVTFLRVIRKEPAAPPASTPPLGCTETFEFSALSEHAAVAVREEEINAVLIRKLSDRMIAPLCGDDREKLGRFFANRVIPKDFAQLTESAINLTLEVDETTATYPWEMMARNRHGNTMFLGTNVGISRQFRSLLAPPPSSPPPLNHAIRVLVIADPTSDLPSAREEGFAIVRVLDEARQAWQKQREKYEIKADIRIGASTDPQDPKLQELGKNEWIASARSCDPLEIAMMIVDEHYDVVHYAGHGFADAKTGRSGWVLDKDFTLSAQEIFHVRRVPRLVFANACLSAVLPGSIGGAVGHSEHRKWLVGVARALLERGIPNFIGTGWKVDDTAAMECAYRFYEWVLGLKDPSRPATISEALVNARKKAFGIKRDSHATWGAYQHYGRVSDRLLPLPAAEAGPGAEPRQDSTGDSTGSETFGSGAAGNLQSRQQPQPQVIREEKREMTTATTAARTTAADADMDLVYVNGINFDTGTYAVPPRTITDLARDVRRNLGLGPITDLRGDMPGAFELRFDVDYNNLENTGWGIVFHEDTPQNIRAALASLAAARKGQAKTQYKELDYKKGEQTGDWYRRNGIERGDVDPALVPYYLLLAGPPSLIPFEFQYLLGIDFAVGRLDFDTPAEYEHYARSILAYESGSSAPNAKEIVYWGTRHPGDPATELSASSLVAPLANGIGDAAGEVRQPVTAALKVRYGQKLFLGEDATKASLLSTLHGDRPPACLFTASHGLEVDFGRPNQMTDQGALVCQDFRFSGSLRPEHYLAAADVKDDANVNGLVAMIFACYGAGTPDIDQFPKFGRPPRLPPQPFIAALPRRLLTHPNGAALAAVGHIDRAFSFSIRPSPAEGPQILHFHRSLAGILEGNRVGHVLTQYFGHHFADLSAILLSGSSQSVPPSMRLSDRALVSRWLERNDAQNYVMLGDPAVRIRTDVLA
jgi:hypothetical protein